MVGIKKAIVQPKNNEKVLKEEIKKKPAYIVGYENRFKSKLNKKIKNDLAEKKAPLKKIEENLPPKIRFKL